MRFEILSEYDGDWSGQIHISALSFSMQNLGKIIWNGLNGSFKIVLNQNKFKHAKAETTIGSINIQVDPLNESIKEFAIQPIKYRYDVTKSSGLLSANTNTYTPQIAITTLTNKKLIIDKFAIHTAFSMDQVTLYNANISINARDIKTSDKTISTISPFHFTLTTSNFSTEGLEDYLNNLNSTNTTKNFQTIDFKILEGLLVHTITPISIIHGNIMLDTPSGAFTCNYKSNWRANVPAPNTFADIIASADIKFSVIISPSLAIKIIELYDGTLVVANTSQGKIAILKHKPAVQPLQNNNTLNKSTLPLPQTDISYISSETPQQLIDELLLGGFIDKDNNNNYISVITIESGVWKMNGTPVYSQ